MYCFSQDTQIVQHSSNLWQGAISQRWGIGQVPNGGYLMSIAAKVLSAALPYKDPLVLSAYYVEKTSIGLADFQVEPIRLGGKIATGQVRLLQHGKEKIRLLGSFTQLDKLAGDTFIENSPPALPPPDQCIIYPRAALEIGNQIEIRYAPHSDLILNRKGNISEFIGWIGFTDQEVPDLFALPTFADGFFPAIFNRIGIVGWIPTLEFTVQLRAKPVPGFILARLRTRYLTQGLLEEDGEFWDASGKLVALSRQLAMLKS